MSLQNPATKEDVIAIKKAIAELQVAVESLKNRINTDCVSSKFLPRNSHETRDLKLQPKSH